MDQALIEKYIKVKALALRGSPGERDNAKRITEKLEREHPGIAKAAAAWIKKQAEMEDEEEAPPKKPKKAKAADPANPYPSGVWEKDEPTPEWSSGNNGNWENIFRYAQAAWNGVYGFAENVSQAFAGRELAQQVESEIKMSKQGNVLVMLRIPLAVYNRAAQLNTMQKAAFRQALHEYVDLQLDHLFGAEKQQP